MKKIISLTALMALAITTIASAQHVDFENSVQLKCVDTANVETTIDVSEMDVLAKSGDRVLNVINGKVYYVNSAEMEGVLEGTIDCEELPDADDTSMFSAGGKETARDLQTALIELGYLSGTADGSFGKKSITALQAFQKDNNLKTASDASTISAESILAAKALAGLDSQPVVHLLGSEPTPEQKFADIYGQTDFDLEPYCTGDYSFTFDKFEKTGVIRTKTAFEWANENASDMDRVAFKISTQIDVLNKGDVYTAVPRIVVECRAARRHYIQSITLQCEGATCKCEAAEATSEIKGTTVIERVVFPMTEEAQSILAAAENNPLSVRFTGKYNTFDAVIG